MDATDTDVKPELVIGDSIPVLLSPLLDVERFRLTDDGFLRRYTGLVGGGGAGTCATKLSGLRTMLPFERVFDDVGGGAVMVADVPTVDGTVTEGVDATENRQSLVRPHAHIVDVGALIAPR